MEPDMKLIDGWLWPKFDEHACVVVPREVARLPQYLAHVDRFGLCVQAGGNVGVYPVALADHFDDVHTFEPDCLNYKCMIRNVSLRCPRRVHCHRGALGDAQGRGATFQPPREADNCGATAVEAGDDFAIFPLDIFELPVDFLFLDVEGWEYPAIVGAEKTIKAHRPTISLELKGLGDRMGWPDADTILLLGDWGYEQVDQIGRDKIFRSK